MPVVLVIKENEDYHSVLLSNKALILGRSSSCDVRLSDERVSGKHLAIKLSSQGKVMIKDLGTTNGSFLNGLQIQESFLMLKDELTIGGVLLTLEHSQLSAKERVVLTREESTQLKFIKLNTQTDTKSEKKRSQPQSAPEVSAQSPVAPVAAGAPSLDFSEDDDVPSSKPAQAATPKKTAQPMQEEDVDPEEFKFEVPKEYQNEVPSEPSAPPPAAKTDAQERLLAAAKIADKVKASKNSLQIDESQFDMEKSSGKTQMIKLQKKDPKEGEPRKMTRKKKAAPESNSSSDSILGKIISLFKK